MTCRDLDHYRGMGRAAVAAADRLDEIARRLRAVAGQCFAEVPDGFRVHAALVGVREWVVQAENIEDLLGRAESAAS